MPAVVEFPDVVQDAMNEFADVFANEPQRKHFAEYLTGLMIAAKKNVSGINAEFAATTDQSCLNRWLNEAPWDAAVLNALRLEWLQHDPSTRYARRGVIAIDDVLIDHDGKLIEDAGWLWDHAEGRNKIAHDYLIANYVCPSGKHYPLEFRRFRKEQDCEQTRRTLEQTPGGFDAAGDADKRRATFKDHTTLFQELVDWTLEQGIPGDFTFDSYFTCAANLNHLHEADRGYVGDLKFNRKLWFRGREIKADALADTIGPEDRKPVKIDGKTQWYFTASLRIPNVDHKVRIVILWNRKNGTKPRKMLVTNRTHWEVERILRVYRFRWTGTETFHRDGKQHLGMGDCQLRNGEGHTRHMYLVMMAYSLLVAEMSHGRAREGTLAKLKTIGEACRAVLRETMGKTIDWVISNVTEDGGSNAAVREYLALT